MTIHYKVYKVYIGQHYDQAEPAAFNHLENLL